MIAGEIAAALNRLAPHLGLGGRDIAELARISSGASLETWSFTLNDASGATKLILRRREAAIEAQSVFTTSIPLQTEAALLAAAARLLVPVAAVVHVCEPNDGLGEAYIVAFIAGETRGKRIVAGDPFATVRPKLAAQCGDILGRIHAIPATTAPLTISDAAGELDRYEAIYRRLGGARPVLELAFQRLRRLATPCPDPVVLHGDFRNGNLIVQPDHGIVAVLDWELSHRGDPAEDLGWLCVNSWRFGAADQPVGGFGTYQALLDVYEAASGRRIALGRLLFWQAVGSLKWAIMCRMMVAAHRAGEGASLERLLIGRRASEAELDLVMLLEALQ